MGTDNALWHLDYNQNNGGWSTWESLGGTLSSTPNAISIGPNHLDIFALGTDYALWHIYWDLNNGGWGSWESWGS